MKYASVMATSLFLIIDNNLFKFNFDFKLTLNLNLA